VSWSSSSERSVAEVGLIATYLGVFALAIASQGADRLRRTTGAIATAIVVVGALALLSRLHPSWFPANQTAQFLPGTQSRLNYPVNYWNGLAALIAIGIPLALTGAMQARWLAVRAIAAAAVPALILTAFYTYSRGGALEVAIALVVLIALHPRRLSLVPTMTISVLASAILIAAATQRDALGNGLSTAAAHSQGNEMLAITLVVCTGAGLVQVAIGLVARHGLGPRVSISRRRAAISFAAIIAVAAVVAVAAGLPGYLSDRWHDFKNPTGAGQPNAQRFDSASGNGRYQYSKAAFDQNATDPVIGTGPGTFEYWWSEHGTIPGFVRNAHSLYFETLGELGIVGLALIATFVFSPIVVGVRKAVRADPKRRGALAGAIASCAAFATAAAVDWVWQIAVIPVAFLLLAAAILTAGVYPPAGVRPVRSAATRAGLVGLGVVALVVIAIPLASTEKVRASQAAVNSHDLSGALSDAQAAANIAPYAASPKLQAALVLELQGNLPSAISAAREATHAESTNWRTWMVLSRLEAERGDTSGAIAAYRKARSLDPHSPLFAQ